MRRKRALLDAAVDLMTEAGFTAVTHRAVAARAGVPLAATTYHFATRDDLVVQAFALLVDHELDHLVTLLERGLNPSHRPHRSERPHRTEPLDRTERPDRTEDPHRTERPDPSQPPDRTDHPHRTDHPDRAERLDRPPPLDGTSRLDRTERSDRSPRSDGTSRFDRAPSHRSRPLEASGPPQHTADPRRQDDRAASPRQDPDPQDTAPIAPAVDPADSADSANRMDEMDPMEGIDEVNPADVVDRVNIVDTAADLLARAYTGDRGRQLGLWQLYLQAGRDPSLQHVARAWTDGCDAIIARLLRQAGLPSGEEQVRFLSAVLSGLWLEEIVEDRPEAIARTRAVVARALQSLA
ncbi:TetR family transcriptional regulator [Streptosporangiaceae bacterium NEAU-GS5]|nr:TetR family transcriptional regulator [Streptosporangiaceae bacterium NEAU-GS5]